MDLARINRPVSASGGHGTQGLWLEDPSDVLSAPMLQEYYNVGVKKMKRPPAHIRAQLICMSNLKLCR